MTDLVSALRTIAATAFQALGVASSQTIKDAASRIETLETALGQIANPIGAMQEQAKREGSILNGPVVVAMSNNADYLKNIAREALKTVVNT